MAAIMMAGALTPWFVDPHGPDSGSWNGIGLPGDRPERLYLAADDLLGVSEGWLTILLSAIAVSLVGAAVASRPRRERVLVLGAAGVLLTALIAAVADGMSILLWGKDSDDSWAIPGLKLGGGWALIVAGGAIGTAFALRGAVAGTSGARVWRALAARGPGLLKLVEGAGFTRLGAACGGVFVAFSAAVPLLVGELLRVDHTRDQVRYWSDGHTSQIGVAAVLSFGAALAFVWWARSLALRLTAFRRNGQRESGGTSVAATGLLLSGAVYLLGLAILAGIARDTEGTAWTSTLVRVSAVMPPLAALGVSIMAGGVSAIARDTGGLRPVSIRLGWGVSLAAFVAAIGLATGPAAFGWWGTFGFLVTAGWILGISWEMWRRP